MFPGETDGTFDDGADGTGEGNGSGGDEVGEAGTNTVFLGKIAGYEGDVANDSGEVDATGALGTIRTEVEAVSGGGVGGHEWWYLFDRHTK